jgi:hypothetical protein
VTLKKCKQKRSASEKGTEIAMFLLTAAGKWSSRLLKNHWAMLKRYGKDAGKFPKVIG